MIKEECKLLDTKSLYRFMKTNKRVYRVCLSVLNDRKKQREEKIKKLFDKISGPIADLFRTKFGHSLIFIDNTYFPSSGYSNLYGIDDRDGMLSTVLDDIEVTHTGRGPRYELMPEQIYKIAKIMVDNRYEVFKLIPNF